MRNVYGNGGVNKGKCSIAYVKHGWVLRIGYPYFVVGPGAEAVGGQPVIGAVIGYLIGHQRPGVASVSTELNVYSVLCQQAFSLPANYCRKALVQLLAPVRKGNSQGRFGNAKAGRALVVQPGIGRVVYSNAALCG